MMSERTKEFKTLLEYAQDKTPKDMSAYVSDTQSDDLGMGD